MRLLPRLFPAADVVALFMGAVLFAVHPVHTEAVAGVVGRAEVLCALWYVLALLVVSSSSATQRKCGRLAMLSMLFVLASLAVLSKEVGVMVLPMCWSVEAVKAVFSRRCGLIGVALWPCLGRLLKFRSISLVVMTIVLMLARLWAMDFESPTFKVMDNPVAAAPELWTRVSSRYSTAKQQSFSI